MIRDFNRNAAKINMPEVFEENVYKVYIDSCKISDPST
jgi:hypothetical protein